VEGKGFLKLMFVVAPDYKVPIRNTIKSRIEKIYDDQKPVLVRNLEDVDSISLTTDTWTSNESSTIIFTIASVISSVCFPDKCLVLGEHKKLIPMTACPVFLELSRDRAVKMPPLKFGGFSNDVMTRKLSNASYVK
jgi:hypothetical protein